MPGAERDRLAGLYRHDPGPECRMGRTWKHQMLCGYCMLERPTAEEWPDCGMAFANGTDRCDVCWLNTRALRVPLRVWFTLGGDA